MTDPVRFRKVSKSQREEMEEKVKKGTVRANKKGANSERLEGYICG